MNAIAVIGAGTMGAGIAQLAAEHGCAVRLIDTDENALARGVENIRKRLDRSIEKGKLSPSKRDSALHCIQTGHEIAGLDHVELAIEAVVEDLKAKQGVFRRLEAETPETTVLATNTSSLSVAEIAEAVDDPSRVIGMHFFNPPQVMPLVEVIPGAASDDSCIELASRTCKSWGKTVVRAKDTPGFIVNRIARGFYLEALRLLGEGVAGVDEIDRMMKTYGGFPMGPFELMDLIGLDVNLTATTSVWQRLGRPPRFEPHEIQQRLVEHGHLGRKSGRGFYVYDDRGPLPAYMVDRRSFEMTPLLSETTFVLAMRAGAAEAGSTEQYAFSRILALIINEAGHVYSDGVANSNEIDIAMTKGVNYPKGPLAWADEIGHRTIRGFLTALGHVGPEGRYAPAKLFADAR